MPTYDAIEAKNKFSELLDRTERGEEVLVTRHREPVAKLVPMKDEATEQKRIHAALDHLRKTREMLKAAGVTFSTQEILALRDEGRR